MILVEELTFDYKKVEIINIIGQALLMR